MPAKIMRKGIFERGPHWLLPTVLAISACGYTPARFSVNEAVTFVHDDYPVPVPEKNTLPDAIRYSEAYIERAVVEGLDPHRTVDSEDVNSMDQVPASSWFSGRRYPNYDEFYKDGPPTMPLKEMRRDKNLPTGVRIYLDHDGRRWETVPNEKYRTGMRPAAGVIASRLVSALGYYVAENYPIKVEGETVLAVRFPAARGAAAGQDAVDLGPTTALGTRLDDPNDVIDHQHRRALRALGLVGAWLGLDEVRPFALRDVYVGIPNIGFVQHQIVGLEDALGAGKLVSILHDTDADRPPHNAWLALGSFGFAKKEKAEKSATPFASIGLLPENFHVPGYRFGVPFPAALEAKPGDLYWIGKRISAITHSRIEEAVSAGELDSEASSYLEKVLLARRDEIARYAMSQVTPLEVVSVEPASARPPVASLGQREPSFPVNLDDVAIRRGFERARGTEYELSFFDEHGSRIHAPETASPRGSAVRIHIPSKLLDQRGYLIVRLKASRDGRSSPRSLELHFRGRSAAPLLRGVRH